MMHERIEGFLCVEIGVLVERKGENVILSTEVKLWKEAETGEVDENKMIGSGIPFFH
jgi:hypothetical protein